MGEAVDAGIVKTPVIGKGRKLVEQPSDDAAVRYQEHLMLGYQRWLASKEEWEKSGKKPLLFVMTEDTGAADQIVRAFNNDPLYEELNGKTVNLHTRLKGRLRKKGRGEAAYYVFEEDEKEISEEDPAELRRLSRELDEDTSPYRCIVSVLMLREGWDVRNVTTIVPLLLERTTQKEEGLPETEPQWLSDWRPYQVTHSERHPAVQAQRTLFNLVPCNNELEVALTTFLDRAADVAAFAKNAGPQALRLDYLNSAGQLSLYTPDFIVRTTDRNYVLIETKGREDPDVPLKARAAVAWCEAATRT